MIHIFFVPGMHGSMIEYVLRAHTLEGDLYGKEYPIARDGSMHSFRKQYHIEWYNNEELSSEVDVTTPLYPQDNRTVSDIIYDMSTKSKSWDFDYIILIYADSIEYAEIAMLMMYQKAGIPFGLELDFIKGGIDTAEIVKKWNPLYTSFNDMQVWEKREWLSLFYPGWVQSLSKDFDKLSKFNLLKIPTSDILCDTYKTVLKILKYTNRTATSKLGQYLDEYMQAQQPILKKHELVNNIVDAAIKNTFLDWQSLDIIAEAIIQKKLRDAGYEIRCDGLNEFPTDSLTLHNLLYSNKIHN